jgi:peptide/nickel transport system substrate-binding protein
MLAPAVLVALSPLGVLHAQSTPAPACDPNASISVLAYKEQPTLDPAKTVGPVSDGTRYWLYDPLIRVTAAGTLEPGLATSWKFVNPTTFQLTLRRGVVFHDGTPFNAAAVKATYERNKAFPGVTASWKQPMADVTGVSVVGDYEVQYQLKAPNPAFAFALTAAPGMIVSPAALNKPLDLDAVGTGPFKLAKYTPNVGADLARNDQYWDKAALACSPKEVHLLDITDTQALLNAAIKGQLHVSRLDPNQVPQAKAAGLTVRSVTTQSIHQFWFDFKNPALRKVGVRKAMMYAVDREALAKGLGLGLALPDAQIFPPGFYPYSAQAEFQPAAYRYDPAKAKQLLADAGYPNGVTLKILLYAFPFDQGLIQAIQAQMAKAGITLEPQVMSSYQTFLARQADAYFGTGSGRPDPFDFLQAQVAANGVYNPDAYPTTPELTAVMQQIAQTDPLDPKRAQLLQQASGLIVEDARTVPILALQFNWALNPCIVNFNPPTFGALQGVGMGWKLGCK